MVDFLDLPILIVCLFVSASTKRSHESWAGGSGGGGGVVGGEQIHRQASTSPVRHTGLVSMAAASPAPASPSSSNASVRKKMVSPELLTSNLFFDSLCFFFGLCFTDGDFCRCRSLMDRNCGRRNRRRSRHLQQLRMRSR